MAVFRDSQVVIIDNDRTVIKVGLGLHELLKTPTAEIQARVGLRASCAKGVNEGDISMNGGADDARKVDSSVKASRYLVGHVLDEALAAGESIRISWPFRNGGIDDWEQAEALWKYVLFTKLGIRRAQNESPVLLSVQPSLSRRTYERITQVFFERLNVAAFSIIERPLAQLYAANNLSGVVIDIGESTTDITPIVDSLIYHNAYRTLNVGIKDCEAHLCTIMRNNLSLIKMISPPENPLSPEDLSEALLSIAQQTWRDGLIKAPLEGEPVVQEEELLNDIAAVLVAGKEKAVIETSLKKRASAKATAAERERAREIEAMDLIQIQWRDLTLTMGKERHRFCEPLFDAALQARIHGSDPIVTQSLQEAVHQSVRGVDVDLRVKVWDGVFIAGDISSAVKGLAAAFRSHLALYVVANQELMTDVQPRIIRTLRVPEYFANFRETGDALACYLGCSIVAKPMFSDPASGTFVSKTDYGQMGPRVIKNLAPTVL